MIKISKDWDCHMMESGISSVAGSDRERREGRSSPGKASVHRFEIYSNTIWKISCSGPWQRVLPTVDSVKLIRDAEKEVTVRIGNTAKAKREKQVVGVCLAGVLWSSGGYLALK